MDYGTQDDAPAAEDLAELSRLSRELVEERACIAAIEESLKLHRQREEVLSGSRIPAAMQVLGVKKLTLADGSEISVRVKESCTVAGAKMAGAVAWLDANGHGGLVKTNVTVALPRTERERAVALLRELHERGVGNVSSKEWVENGSLLAHLKELKKAGVPFPEDTFGWYERTVTEVK